MQFSFFFSRDALASLNEDKNQSLALLGKFFVLRYVQQQPANSDRQDKASGVE